MAGLFSPNITTAVPTQINWQLPQIVNLPYIQSAKTSNFIRVKGIEGARSYPTGPNSDIGLFDEDEDLMYRKITDNNNYSVIEVYEFRKRETESKPDLKEYVTGEDFNKFKEELLNGKQSIRKHRSNYDQSEYSVARVRKTHARDAEGEWKSDSHDANADEAKS